jgi:hypothetical protein
MMFSPKAINFTSGVWAQGGSGVVGNYFPWFASPYLDITAANYASIAAGVGLSLGDFWWNNGTQSGNEGNAFMLVKANAALAIGQIVQIDAPQAGTYTAAGSTASKLVTNITEAGAVNSEVDNYINVIATSQTVPNMRRIKGNTTGANAVYTISLPDYLRPSSPADLDVLVAPSLANGDPLQIIRPWNVVVGTTNGIPVGVALGTVTSGSYTIVQVAGLTQILANGTTTLTVNQPATLGTLGRALGLAAATQYAAGYTILPQVTNNTAGTFVPAYVNFIGV